VVTERRDAKQIAGIQEASDEQNEGTFFNTFVE
jgi:hypothetical protein